MSLVRLIYYGALIGGWAALVGWGISAFLQSALPRFPFDWMEVVLTTAFVGAALGAGLNLVAGMANTQWKQQLRRVGLGLAIGGIGGILGGAAGSFVYTSLGLPRVIGWMVLGACIGVVEGLTERSWIRVRNGLIGGLIGGLLGGILIPVLGWIPSRTGIFGQALGLVALGMCIGAFVAFVKVALREAWLTVEDGYRPGRELILTEPVTVLGRGEHVELPFFSRPGQDLEPEHARIIRHGDGHYDIEDNRTRLGTRINGQPIAGTCPLKDDDVIQVGANIVRFRERHPQPNTPVTAAKARAPARHGRPLLRQPYVQRSSRRLPHRCRHPNLGPQRPLGP